MCLKICLLNEFNLKISKNLKKNVHFLNKKIRFNLFFIEEYEGE